MTRVIWIVVLYIAADFVDPTLLLATVFEFDDAVEITTSSRSPGAEVRAPIHAPPTAPKRLPRTLRVDQPVFRPPTPHVPQVATTWPPPHRVAAESAEVGPSEEG